MAELYKIKSKKDNEFDFKMMWIGGFGIIWLGYGLILILLWSQSSFHDCNGMIYRFKLGFQIYFISKIFHSLQYGNLFQGEGCG